MVLTAPYSPSPRSGDAATGSMPNGGSIIASRPSNFATGSNVVENTYIARLIIKMNECLLKLGQDIEDDSVIEQVERMSTLIYESMSTSGRNYHSVQHVFDVSRNLEDPIATLAALFHDCIYHQVDGGLSKLQVQKLEGVVHWHESVHAVRTDKTPGSIYCTSESVKQSIFHPHTSDPLLGMVEVIFGYHEIQEMNNLNGVNEFLSTVLALRELTNLLNTVQLAQIAVCIEATIPFRPLHSETGQSPMELLYERLTQVNDTYQLGLSKVELVESIQRAVRVANRDCENFGSPDCQWFLDNTWSILPECNKSLRSHSLYTVGEFQCALYSMYGFFSFLQPSLIFQQFRGIPSPEEYQLLVDQATRNLQVGRQYVGAKLVSLSVVAAFAELTGGDAPISLFIGDLPSRHSDPVDGSWIEIVSSEFIDDERKASDCDPDVYTLLAQGRRTEASFDVRQSPLAAGFYGRLGDRGLVEILQAFDLFPMTVDTARALLSRLPRGLIMKLANKMAKVAVPRATRIQQVIDELSTESS